MSTKVLWTYIDDVYDIAKDAVTCTSIYMKSFFFKKQTNQLETLQ